jgi:hypothetical protein
VSVTERGPTGWGEDLIALSLACPITITPTEISAPHAAMQLPKDTLVALGTFRFGVGR